MEAGTGLECGSPASGKATEGRETLIHAEIGAVAIVNAVLVNCAA